MFRIGVGPRCGRELRPLLAESDLRIGVGDADEGDLER